MKRYIGYIIESAEARTEDFLKNQVTSPESDFFGGLPDDILNVKPTIYGIATATAVYLCRDSRFYGDGELYRAICCALDFAAANQRPSGRFDYPVCNFDFAPDTAFCFKRLFDTYVLAEKYKDEADTAALREKCLKILHLAAEGISHGGFHTPNHRWAIASALCGASKLFSDDAEFSRSLRKRADEYLAEGIDCDADGEYSERSSGNYSAVVNRAIIGIYEATGDTSYLDYVFRNLDMLLCFIERDGVIFTENSTRQDKGARIYADKYFYQYLYAATSPFVSSDLARKFDAAAHKIISDCKKRGYLAPDCLHFLMARDNMLSHEFEGCGYLPFYRRFFGESGILRVMNEKYSLTVMRGSSAFLHFSVGDLKITAKIGESLCEVRNFIPQAAECCDGGCAVEAHVNSWYYAPRGVPTDPRDNSERERIISASLETRVFVTEHEDGAELHISTSGLDRVPLRLEICVPSGTRLENETVSFSANPSGRMILRSGYLDMTYGGHTVLLKDGFCEHEFKGHYSGEESDGGKFTIFCNAYTPVDKTISLTVIK
ncbi:MAG: hypothetical protein LUH59_00280 [Firmicutes bacterium]|nr:hypothetical protein [Bacillota bacterium]